MTIQEIKEKLNILTVLNHYGLKPDRNKRINCPFHDDKTPSMQVYPETGTVFCFSSNCRLNGHAIDSIDFIMLSEAKSRGIAGYNDKQLKHQAILKAKEMLGIPASPKPVNNKPMNTANDLQRTAVLTKLMQEAKESISRSQKARDYCQKRGLDYKGLEIGYLSDRFYHSWREKLKQSAIEIGLLKENPNGRLSPVFRHCIVFPCRNQAGQITGIYGRSIFENKGARHFYLKGSHQGVYPKYPAVETRKLILCESIIDTASLLQIESVTQKYSLLSLYGTNGLTGEMTAAVKGLQELGEIIFLMDGDQAGDKSTERYSQELNKLLPGVKISKGELPRGEDVNSLLVGHEAGIIEHLLKERVFLFQMSSNERKQETASGSETDQQHPESTLLAVSEVELNTSNPDKIIYDTPLLKIEIWGGVEYGHLHRLRLSLYLENKATGASFRDDVNLYSNRGSKAFLQDASEEMDMPVSELKAIINNFTRQVEAYRLQQKEAYKKRNQPEKIVISRQEQQEALKLLKDRNITAHLKTAMQRVGLIGETENGLLLFLIFLTRCFDAPLHALVHGSSGSGKTNLLKSILELVPPESKYETTALTENVLFRPPHKDFWKNKILLLEDLDGSYKALYPLREFMSNQYISKFASEPNPKTGKYEQSLLEAHGPVVIAGATTKDKVYEDNSNRSFLLHVNEEKSHQDQILEYQNKAAAGLIDKAGKEAACRKIHNMQRMLNRDIRVINPFQPELKLPEYVFRKLRTNTHYITLIQAITFLFQHQREHKKDRDGNIYIETTLEDVALANALSKESLLRKSDELSGAIRSFFESLKAAVQQSGKENFLAKEIRSRMRMHPMKFSRYINELRNRGYVKKVGGKEKGSFEYQIITWDDYQVLQKGLQIMDRILEKLWKQYPDGIYKKGANNSYFLENNTTRVNE